MKIKNKVLSSVVMAVGLSAMLLAPASQAHWRRAHWVNTRVHYRGCRRITVRRYCRYNRFGERYGCFRTRRVRWVC